MIKTEGFRKISIVFLLLFSWSFALRAQVLDNGMPPISLSYYAPLAIQVGTRVGTAISLRNWEPAGRERVLLVRPQIGYFSQLGLHRNFVVETDLAFRLKKAKKRSYLSPSLGLGYINSVENIEGSVNLGSGEIDQKTENYHYFLPTINLEWGLVPKKNLGYFFKFFMGRKVGAESDAAFFGIEIGLNFHITQKGVDTDE